MREGGTGRFGCSPSHMAWMVVCCPKVASGNDCPATPKGEHTLNTFAQTHNYTHPAQMHKHTQENIFLFPVKEESPDDSSRMTPENADKNKTRVTKFATEQSQEHKHTHTHTLSLGLWLHMVSMVTWGWDV